MPLDIDKAFGEFQISAAENPNTMLAYWDKNLICRYANNAYLHWFGIHPSRMIDKMHIKELLGPLYELNLPYITAALHGKEGVFDRYISLTDGSTKIAPANYIPHIDKGEVKGFYVKVSNLGTIIPEPGIDKSNIIDRSVNFLQPKKDVLEEVVETLKSCIFHDFPGIASLAKKHYISESKLKRDFKEHFGETIFSYYRNLQMELAYEYISSKKANKSQMAHALNFSNPSNFSTCYHNYLNNKAAKAAVGAFTVEDEEKYQAIIDQTPLPIAVLDNQLRFLKASEEFIIGHQLQGEDYVGKSIYDSWPESKELYQEKLERSLLGEVSRSAGSRLKKADGTLCLRRWDIRPWHNVGNGIGGALIYSESITPELLQQEEYKKMNAVLSKAHEIVRMGTWERDFVNNVNTWSPVLKEILEVPEDFDPTLEDTLVFYKDDATREMIIKLRKEAMENGTPFDIEIDMITAKGKDIRIRAVGYTDIVNGHCVKAHGVFQELTKIF